VIEMMDKIEKRQIKEEVKVEIKNFKFSEDFLKIQPGTTIHYYFSANNQIRYDSLYSKNQRFLLLYIEELAKELDPLFH